MTWDHNHVIDPADSAGRDLTPLTGRRRRVGQWRVNEAITLGTTQLESDLTWEFRFHYPDTFTDEEAREEFDALVHTIITNESPALTKCLMIIGMLPEPLIPTVLDQFQEIAQYETRLWRHRIERGDRPSIGEDIRVLPAGRE